MHRYQAIRHLIDLLVTDLLETVRARIAEHEISSAEDIRDLGRPIATFSAGLDPKVRDLKAFLMDRLYRHNRVVRMTRKAQRVMEGLFETYMDEPRQLPPHILRRTDSGETLARVVADYIAGMTDRFAVEEYGKLFNPSERV